MNIFIRGVEKPSRKRKCIRQCSQKAVDSFGLAVIYLNVCNLKLAQIPGQRVNFIAIKRPTRKERTAEPLFNQPSWHPSWQEASCWVLQAPLTSWKMSGNDAKLAVEVAKDILSFGTFM